MGYWKDLLIEQQERGYASLGDKFVCARCFSDYALAGFVTENASGKHCDYCGRSSRRKAIAVAIDDVLAEIASGIWSEWGAPEDEGVPYESREGGWQGTVISSWELFYDEIEDPFSNDELREDVIGAFGDNQWCQKDFYSLRPEDALLYGWDEFVEIVKHKTRYLFSLAPDPYSEYRGHEEIPPSAFLEKIGELIPEISLIRILPAGSKIYRARVHEPLKEYKSAIDLGPPPAQLARFSNRMSPAGISMFYGASDADTAIAETYALRTGEEKVVTVGCFKTAREFSILDLTTLPRVPSIFDSRSRHLRPGLIFMRRFTSEMSTIIEKDGREHIEYVPTQIFTEYIRRLYSHPAYGQIRGIKYKSAQNGHECYVLFFASDQCCDIHRGWTETPKQYSDKPKWWLGMMPKPRALKPTV